jgi:hypothetical protein
MKPPALLTDEVPEDTVVQRRTSGSELTDLKSATQGIVGDFDDATEDHFIPPLRTEDFDDPTPIVDVKVRD